MTDQPRVQRAYRLIDLPMYLGIKRSGVQELIAAGHLKLHAISAGGRARVIFEDELLALQSLIKSNTPLAVVHHTSRPKAAAKPKPRIKRMRLKR